MITMQVDVDEKKIEKKLTSLSSQANTAISRAANRSAATAKKYAQQETAKRYFVKSGDVGKTITVKRATKSRPYAGVISKDAHQNLAGFKVSPMRRYRVNKSGSRNPKAYKVKVMKSHGWIRLDGDNKPFVATMPNGFTGMFRRKEGKRDKIKGVYSPAIPQIIKNKETMEVVNKETQKMLDERLQHEIKRILEG